MRYKYPRACIIAFPFFRCKFTGITLLILVARRVPKTYSLRNAGRAEFALRKKPDREDPLVFCSLVTRDTRAFRYPAAPSHGADQFLFFANRVGKLRRPPKDALVLLPCPSLVRALFFCSRFGAGFGSRCPLARS